MDPALAALAGKVLAGLLDEAAKIRPHVHGEWHGALEYVQDGELYHVRQRADDPLRLWVPELGFEYAYRGGFDSDGGSVPKVLQDIPRLRLKPDSFLKSYFLHDYLYAEAGCWCRAPEARVWSWMPVTRSMADCLLYIALTAEDATLAESRAIFRAVRFGGAIAWHKHRREAL